jgi:hypothetical protein
MSSKVFRIRTPRGSPRVNRQLDGEDLVDFADVGSSGDVVGKGLTVDDSQNAKTPIADDVEREASEEDEDGGAVADYLIYFVVFDVDYFEDWRLW